MERSTHEDPELRWLVGLARALVGDGEASDLAQDTLVGALEAPPPAGVPRRAWLRGVARRLAAKGARSAARARGREVDAARPEALPSTLELVARAEAAEAVSAAAKRLPEPYRRAVLLRHLEGLDVAEIARLDGVPADTVRWRLRRGLELLRTELDRRGERGGWGDWRALVLPLVDTAPSAPSVLLGSVLFMTMTKALLLATTLGLAAWWLLHAASTDEPENSPTAARGSEARGEARSSSRSAATDFAAAETTGDARSAVAAIGRSAGSTARDESSPDAALALGRIVDERGHPIEDALVAWLASDGMPFEGAPEVRSEPDGSFRIAPNSDSSTVGVVANGFQRRAVDVRTLEPAPDGRAEGWHIVLERGRRLTGRVFDAERRAVPGLPLVAYTAGAPIDHVSPSRRRLRADARVRSFGDAAAYDQCFATTDADGWVEFAGLADGEVAVRSLAPGWTIDDPRLVTGDAARVEWIARARLGVEVEVIDARTGAPVDRARATFFVRLEFADGTSENFGQWVGSGDGRVTFALPDGGLPDLGERRPVRATFHGDANRGAATATWEAEALDVRGGLTGVAAARVALDGGAKGAERSPLEDLPLDATLELEVAYSDGVPFDDALQVSWTLDGARGADRARSDGPGRYSVAVPAGRLELRVATGNAQGSLEPWTGTIETGPGEGARVAVTLRRGARIRIARPLGWSGEWFVHASLRGDADEGEFRGSWTYGTSEDELLLTALRPAEWRFTLRRTQSAGPEDVERRVVLDEGDDAFVDG